MCAVHVCTRKIQVVYMLYIYIYVIYIYIHTHTHNVYNVYIYIYHNSYINTNILEYMRVFLQPFELWVVLHFDTLKQQPDAAYASMALLSISEWGFSGGSSWLGWPPISRTSRTAAGDG